MGSLQPYIYQSLANKQLIGNSSCQLQPSMTYDCVLWVKFQALPRHLLIFFLNIFCVKLNLSYKFSYLHRDIIMTHWCLGALPGDALPEMDSCTIQPGFDTAL